VLPTKCSRLLALVLVLLAIGIAAVSAAEQPGGFTVVLLPDTQLYCESHPEIYLAQTEWIKRRAAADNIKFVIHLGDIVQNVDAEAEWKNADRAHRVLDGVVPYSVLPGNHDGAPGSTALYNKYFGPGRFKGCPWYGPHVGEKNDNNACRFEAAGMKFMVLSLQYDPGKKALDWANQIVRRHKDRRVIVATHCYTRPGRRDPIGERIWNGLVRKNENVFMTVSGHVLGWEHLTSTNDAGRPVHEILSDYQGLPNGGDGWLQTLRFLPERNQIQVRAYSPTLDKYNQDPRHTYTLDYTMPPGERKKAG
jgi:3',5'-cyclic AMP phosphodiesterase CpdA